MILSRRHSLKHIILFFTALSLLSLRAVPSEAKWEIFTSKNTVRDVLVDAAGSRIYISTGGGLVELSLALDAPTYRTTLEGLANNDLTCLALGSDGNLIVGMTSDGMAILFTDGQIRNYSTFDGLPTDQVLCVTSGDGDFWVGTTGGAVRMELVGRDVNRLSPIYFGDPLDYEVRKVMPDGSKVWFATSGGFWLLENDAFQSWLTGQGLADNSVRDILPLEGDSLLVATDSGIQVFLPGSGVFHDLSQGLVTTNSKNVRQLASVNGVLWAATRSGVYRFDTGQGSWVDETLDLPSRDVLSVAAHPNGVPVVGLEREGVAMRGGGTWTALDFPGPLMNSLDKVVVDDRGVVWATSWSVDNSSAGVFRFDSGSYQNYTRTNSDLLLNQASSLIEAPDGSIWIGSPWFSDGGSGISILDDGGTPALDDDAWTLLKGTETGLSGDAIRNSIAFKGTGEAWVGSWNEPGPGLPGGLDLVKYSDGNFTFRSFLQLMQGRRIKALAIDARGDLFIGYITTGFDVFVLRSVTAEGDSLFFSADPNLQYLAGENVSDLEIDPLGHLWVCTASGVTELDYGGDAANTSGYRWKSYTMGNSLLPDIQANAVAFQGSRFAWFATPSGAAKYDRDLDTWEIFDTDNSPIPEDNVKDVFVDQQSGAVWFATEGGLAMYQRIGDEPTVRESGSIIAAPNPFFPGRSPQGVLLGRFDPGTTIEVYSVAGSRVAHLAAQTETIRWDGSSETGEKLASGVYILVSTAPDGTVGRGKIAIIR